MDGWMDGWGEEGRDGDRIGGGLGCRELYDTHFLFVL